MQQCLTAVQQAAERLAPGSGARDLAAATVKAAAALTGQPAVAGPLEVFAAAGTVWNAAVELERDEAADAQEVAAAKQCASDLLALLPLDGLPERERFAAVRILHKTGVAWATLGRHESADAAYAKALESGQWLQGTCFATRNWGALEEDCSSQFFDLLLARLQSSRHLGQQMLASALLARVKDLACDERLPSRQAASFKLDLAHDLKAEGLALLQAHKVEAALPLLSLSYELLTLIDELAELAAEQESVKDMVSQVLILLTLAYSMTPGGEERAVSCLQTLQQVDVRAGERISLPVLSHQICLRMGRVGEAETELLSLVSHEDITADVALAALKLAVATPGGLASVKASLPLVLERFADEATLIILGLADQLRDAPAPLDEELEALLLEVIADDRALEMLHEEPAKQGRLFGLLWNYAMRKLEEQQPEGAQRFFSACLAVARGPSLEVAGRGACTWQAQALYSKALCFAQMSQFGRALECAEAVEELQPKQLEAGFLRLKLSLMAHDGPAAAQAVVQLAACEGATPDVMRVACLEALDAGAPAAAKQALLKLLEMVAAGDSEQYGPGYEAHIFQNLIKLIQDTTPAAASPAGTGATAMEVDGLEGNQQQQQPNQQDQQPQSQPAPSTRACELAKYLDMAVQRMKAVGPSRFFAEENGRLMQLEWLALTAWSAACEASNSSQLQQAAVIMGASGELWAAHPQPSPATLAKEKTAYLFAATAAMDVYDASPQFEGSLALARQYLASARQAASAAADALPLGAAPANANADAFLLLSEYMLATRARDVRAQLEAIERARAAPTFPADYFAKMAAAVKEGKYASKDIRLAAEQAALQRLTSQPSLNYAHVAATLRALFELSKLDADKLQLLTEAHSIIKSAPKGAYPECEVVWLVTEAFNRGSLHLRFWEAEAAGRFVRLAIDLLPHCPKLAAAHQATMEGVMAECTKLSAADKPAQGGTAALESGLLES